MTKRWDIWFILNVVTLFAFPFWYPWDTYECQGKELAAGRLSHDTSPGLSPYSSFYLVVIFWSA